MGYIRATFLGKEYSIPEDVLIYLDLLDFTENIKNQLVNAFVRKLKAEIQKGNIGLLDDKDLATEIEQQVCNAWWRSCHCPREAFRRGCKATGSK